MLRLHLLLNRPYYEPGRTVVSTVQVYNDSEVANSSPIRIRELVFLGAGYERTDANWISNLWRPEAKIEHTDARKGVRTLFRTDGTTLMRNFTVPLNAAHQFTIKFRLPSDLPPSFRGNSICFNYRVDVKALYEPDQGATTPPPLYETTATTSLLVWPTPATWSSLMLKKQPKMQHHAHSHSQLQLSHQQQQSHSQLQLTQQQQPGPQELQPLLERSAAALSTPFDLPNQQSPTPARAPLHPSQSQSHANSPAQQTPLSTPRNALGGAGSGSGAETPLGSICERGEDGGAAASVHALQAVASLKGASQSPSAMASRRPSCSGTLLRRNSSSSSTIAPQGGGVVGVARTADDMDVPCVDYALRRSVRTKFREVPVDTALLQGGVAAFGTGSTPHPLPSMSSGPGATITSSPLYPTQPQTTQPPTPAPADSATVTPSTAPTGTVAPSEKSTSDALTATATSQPPPAGADTAATAAVNGANGAPASTMSDKAAQGAAQAPSGQANASAASQSQAKLSYAAANRGGDTVDGSAWSDSDSGSDAENSVREPHYRSTLPSTSQQHGSASQRHLGYYGGSAAVPPSSSTPPPPRPQVFGRLFVLNAGDHPVLKITLQAPLDTPLQPGATFGGLLDLRPLGPRVSSPARCHHLVIALETEEVVDHKHHSQRVLSGGSAIRKLHCEHQEVTTDLHLTHFVFSIPSSATPSFKTPMVGLRWVLRFELAVGKPLDLLSTGQQQQLQSLTWALPMIVQAPG